MRLLAVTFAEFSGLGFPLAESSGIIDLDEVATAQELFHSQHADGFPDTVPGTLVAMKGWGGSYFILTPWQEFSGAWSGARANRSTAGGVCDRYGLAPEKE